jgi:serine/threonine protein kinase
MELMEISLHNLYIKVKPDTFPENILSQFALSMFKGLNFLKTKLNVMHRDVKPSNSWSRSEVTR